MLVAEQGEQDGYRYRALQIWPAPPAVGEDAERPSPESLARDRLRILDALARALDRRTEVLDVTQH